MEELPRFHHAPLIPVTYDHLYRTTTPAQLRPSSTANPDLLIQSAKLSQSLLQDAKKVIDMLASSKPFAEQLMNAAQQSQKSVVTGMIQKTGVHTVPDINYNPEGIRLDFYPKTGEDYCHIIINLKWMHV